tara:strand:- start:250 stop:378 length:129 start_codon:yes stop_codon:yes gene_type:complete
MALARPHLLLLLQPIQRAFCTSKMLADHMGIDLRGGNIRMTQ